VFIDSDEIAPGPIILVGEEQSGGHMAKRRSFAHQWS
jgi:hypothetical protein